MIARSARGLIVLLIALATSVAAKADAIVLTFEGVGDMRRLEISTTAARERTMG